MKKLTLLLMLLATVAGTQAYARQHLIEVKRYNDYGKDYLTITNYRIYKDKTTGKYGCYNVSFNVKAQITNAQNEVETKELKLTTNGGAYSLVTEVNGKSTKGMSEAEFYNIIDNCDGDIVLKLWHSCTREPETYTLRHEPYPELFSRCGVTPDMLASGTSNASKAYQERESGYKKTNTFCTELKDPDFDWFYVATYDFLIVGDDPLTDKTLLKDFVDQNFRNLKQDSENPDILITISKNANETISSTYVPPTSRTVNAGSRTYAQYNYITKRTDYVTRQNNYTVREGGYTETTKDTDIFLEVAILDAKKLNDPNQQTAPIVWQMTTRRHAVNANFSMLDEYKAYLSWATQIPVIWDRTYVNTKTLYNKNIEVENNVITFVREGSSAQRMGLQVGDKLLSYKNGKKYIPIDYPGRKPGYNPRHYHQYKIERNGKVIKLAGTIRDKYGDIQLEYLGAPFVK